MDMARRFLALVFSLACAVPAFAGIADSPLPVLQPGATTYHLYSVLGVASNAYAATVFTCTSTDTAPQQVGVEIFGAAGGDPSNDATMTSVSVPSGGTTVIETPHNHLLLRGREPCHRCYQRISAHSVDLPSSPRPSRRRRTERGEAARSARFAPGPALRAGSSPAAVGLDGTSDA